ncbi:MAG: hypothetical protein JWQ25_3336, partial [Daejeonella sp.]|nr:hypothetical protein [Daejeonella sp.]
TDYEDVRIGEKVRNECGELPESGLKKYF